MSGIIEKIVFQHAEEVAFLWTVRNRAVDAQHYSLRSVARLDERLEAHLDGLRVAGEPGWEICKVALGLEWPGEVFAAAVLGFESGREEWIMAVLEVATKSPEPARGLVSALGWIPYTRVKEQIQTLLRSDSSTVKRIGLAASIIHRHDPGSALRDAVSSPDVALRARALRAIGELGRTDLLAAAKVGVNDADEACRCAAAWSALLLGDTAAIPFLQLVATQGMPSSQSALELVTRRMSSSQAKAWQQELAGKAETRRLAVQVSGLIGDPVSIPWLMDQISVPALARIAGESFAILTGADLVNDMLEGKKPDGFEAGPTENPEDENVEMDPDENLSWPDPELVKKWWSKHQNEFTNGTRYLLGKPIGIDWLQHVLRNGRQRHRAVAALELAIRQPDTPLFNTSAPGFRQQALLGLKS
ncbi:MAG: TIGR02270 family protein [Nitrospirota bacterium]